MIGPNQNGVRVTPQGNVAFVKPDLIAQNVGSIRDVNNIVALGCIDRGIDAYGRIGFAGVVCVVRRLRHINKMGSIWYCTPHTRCDAGNPTGRSVRGNYLPTNVNCFSGNQQRNNDKNFLQSHAKQTLYSSPEANLHLLFTAWSAVAIIDCENTLEEFPISVGLIRAKPSRNRTFTWAPLTRLSFLLYEKHPDRASLLPLALRREPGNFLSQRQPSRFAQPTEEIP